MIRITDSLAIAEAALTWRFVRAPGPGGQNVNKVATAVELRFDTAVLPDDVHARLRTLAGRRLGRDGTLVLHARWFRSQERNRADALERLLALLRQAATAPTPRRPTRPSAGAKGRRLESKRRRGATKQARGRVTDRD